MPSIDRKKMKEDVKFNTSTAHTGKITQKSCTPVSSTMPVTRGTRELYVDCNNHHRHQNGKSWKKAYNDLQTALDRAKTDLRVSKINIACGTYKPSKTFTSTDAEGNEVVAGTMSMDEFNPGITQDEVLLNYADNPEFYNHKLKTFQLIDGVDLEGGFVVKHGKPSNCKKCSCDKCKTILDGNLGTCENPDKVWHVMTAGNDITYKGISCSLSNLVVQNGDATPAQYFPINYLLNENQIPVYYHDDGGGLYVVCKSFINLNNIIFKKCKGIAGGGVYFDDGGILNFTDCIFEENEGYDGIAVQVRDGGQNELNDYSHRHSTANFKRCNFSKNHSINDNGTITGYDNYDNLFNISGPTIKLDHCTFKDPTLFGTIVSYAGTLEINDCLFNGNNLNGTLAIYYAGPTSIKITKSIIKNHSNNNGIAGGGVSIRSPVILNNANIEISDCTFINNKTVDENGGALSVRSATGIPLFLRLHGNTFIDNDATNNGGAIYLRDVVVLNNDWTENEFKNNKATLGNDIYAENNVYLPKVCKKELKHIDIVVAPPV